jgi:putative transposase
MRKSRFSEQQIAIILKQVDDGLGVDDVCRKAGVAQQTCYRWRKKYGGLMPSEVKRLKQLEEENRRLKEMVADLSPDKAILQDVLSKKAAPPVAGRPQTAHQGDLGDTGAVRVSTGRQANGTFAVRRRIHVLLQREGWEVNVKRVYRLYTELGLQIRNRRPKRKVSAKLREGRRPPEGPNDVWAFGE